MTPILLSIDTSSAVSFVSIQKEGQLFSACSEAKNSHNEEIDSLVKEAASKAKIDFSQISGLLLGCGPGSFTGLRISSAYLKGLSVALRVPIYQYSSLECPAYFLSAKLNSATVCSIANAGRGEFYACIMNINNGTVSELCPPEILLPEVICGRLEGCRDVAMIPLSTELPELLSHYPPLVLQSLSEALLAMHIKLEAKDSPKKPYKLDEIAEMEPLYLRPVAAQTLIDRGIILEN